MDHMLTNVVYQNDLEVIEALELTILNKLKLI
jgi:hypothetical protein